MSARREHKRRYNQKLRYIHEFESWLSREPSRLCFWAWRKWLRSRPDWKEVRHEAKDWYDETYY